MIIVNKKQNRKRFPCATPFSVNFHRKLFGDSHWEFLTGRLLRKSLLLSNILFVTSWIINHDHHTSSRSDSVKPWPEGLVVNHHHHVSNHDHCLSPCSSWLLSWLDSVKPLPKGFVVNHHHHVSNHDHFLIIIIRFRQASARKILSATTRHPQDFHWSRSPSGEYDHTNSGYWISRMGIIILNTLGHRVSMMILILVTGSATEGWNNHT